MFKSISCMDPVECFKTGDDRVTIVSGLPRSGTSMMMRMLALGGIEPLTDNVREGDSRNPHGYFEWESIKHRKDYVKWMDAAAGKSLKAVSRFIKYLPATHCYDILFMHRTIDDVLTSQVDIAAHFSGAVWSAKRTRRLKTVYQRHVDDTLTWIEKRPNMRVCELQYEIVLDEPTQEVRRICDFLTGRVLLEKEMLSAIDPALRTLARNRRA
jgi:Sulfotransferase domain